jgi:5-methylcytosine-specific restriction endonuclease McrA
MYISKKNKELIRNKYNGKCAYSGTFLEDDFQIDHIKPIRRNSYLENIENHNFENLVPCQKIINHYKHTYDLETFRTMILTLPSRIAKLPKKPKTEKSIKHKKYMFNLYQYFENFDGLFYFERNSV